jgi:hypothetical protein
MSDSIEFSHFIRFRSEGTHWRSEICFRKAYFIFTAHARFHFVQNVWHFAEKKRSWNKTLRFSLRSLVPVVLKQAREKSRLYETVT